MTATNMCYNFVGFRYCPLKQMLNQKQRKILEDEFLSFFTPQRVFWALQIHFIQGLFEVILELISAETTTI